MGQRGQGGDNFMDRLIRDAHRQDAQGAGGHVGLLPNTRAQQNFPQQPQAAENPSGNNC